ncbi:Zinc finger MYM-type protein 1 [Holothuria leucospilota]|uniref:Zinc finger MYM-type protein 1 n=1 Tax=Holothuria leucospilota TaxID=206669 RepID=A0A9Q1BE08_HOLLE|nr:Zinc finger MYM-type protein 1 [Holothuria leucospilota]
MQVKGHGMQVKKNHRFLEEVIITILFLARQGLAFRGHREGDDSDNRGNYLELLQLRARDNALISEGLNNKTYTSHVIQDEIISILGMEVRNIIVQEIQSMKPSFYTIMMDETRDISRKEQVSLCVKYVTKDMKKVHERFLGSEASSTTCEALYSLLKGKYPMALTIHCYAHLLNLVLVDWSKEVPAVKTCLDMVQELYTFVTGSFKRNATFENIQRQLNDGGKKTTLKPLSDSRWSCRADALKVICQEFKAILETTENITTEDTNPKSRAEAEALLMKVATFDFVFITSVLNDIY